tara:strand:- start:392 stop:550 length:159 start_codon:yes stop_codon:yes gene_type:complete
MPIITTRSASALLVNRIPRRKKTMPINKKTGGRRKPSMAKKKKNKKSGGRRK